MSGATTAISSRQIAASPLCPCWAVSWGSGTLDPAAEDSLLGQNSIAQFPIVTNDSLTEIDS